MGLQCFHHGGGHFYYQCLLHSNDFTALNAIKDVGKTSNEKWKELLRAHGDAAALALADAVEAERLARKLVPLEFYANRCRCGCHSGSSRC